MPCRAEPITPNVHKHEKSCSYANLDEKLFPRHHPKCHAVSKHMAILAIRRLNFCGISPEPQSVYPAGQRVRIGEKRLTSIRVGCSPNNKGRARDGPPDLQGSRACSGPATGNHNRCIRSDPPGGDRARPCVRQCGSSNRERAHKPHLWVHQ